MAEWSTADSTAAFNAGAAAAARARENALRERQFNANREDEAWSRMERAQELRSRESERLIRERHLAAQADAIVQSTQMKQALQAKTEMDLTHAWNIYHEISNTTDATEEQAQETAQNWLLEHNPKAALEVQKVLSEKSLMQSRNVRSKDISSGLNFEPSITTVENPETKEQIPVIKTGPRKMSVLKPASPDKVEELKRAHEASAQYAKTDPELSARYKALEDKLTQASGMTIRTNPDGTFEVIQGAQPNPDSITKANLNKVQEAQAQSLATIDIAERLLPLISNETVGAKAFAESWVNDRILAQYFPELASEKRASAEQLAAQLRASTVKALKSDSNITDNERKQILEAVPQINAPADSPQRAKMLVKGIKKMAAISSLVAAKRIGGAIPKQAAQSLDDEDLADLFTRGLITQDQAKQAYQMKRQ